MRNQTIEAVVQRRSHSKLNAPAPDSDQLQSLIEVAATAPDHGRLHPWTFIAIRPSEYPAFGEVLVGALRRRCSAEGTTPTEAQIDKERTKLGRAPLVIVAAATYRPSVKIPRVEQFAAVAAATQNLLVAATARGWGSMWRTGPATYDPGVKTALGLREDDDIVGFIYLGTAPAEAERRPRRHRTDVLVTWTGPSS